MKITLTARVNLGGSLWDSDAVEHEVKVETENENDFNLPWAEICASLVQSAIQERLSHECDQEEATA